MDEFLPGEADMDGDDLEGWAEWLLTLPADVAAAYIEQLGELAEIAVETDEGLAENFGDLVTQLQDGMADAGSQLLESGTELLDPVTELGEAAEGISMWVSLAIVAVVGAVLYVLV